MIDDLAQNPAVAKTALEVADLARDLVAHGGHYGQIAGTFLGQGVEMLANLGLDKDAVLVFAGSLYDTITEMRSQIQ
jgi:hypothetical protein